MNRKLELINQMESHPDTWFRKLALPMYKEACRTAADFVHSKYDNVVLVRNTTQGEFTLRWFA